MSPNIILSLAAVAMLAGTVLTSKDADAMSPRERGRPSLTHRPAIRHYNSRGRHPF